MVAAGDVFFKCGCDECEWECGCDYYDDHDDDGESYYDYDYHDHYDESNNCTKTIDMKIKHFTKDNNQNNDTFTIIKFTFET